MKTQKKADKLKLNLILSFNSAFFLCFNTLNVSNQKTVRYVIEPDENGMTFK